MKDSSSVKLNQPCGRDSFSNLKLTEQESEALRKYRQWTKSGGGPPYLSNEELKIIINKLELVDEIMRMLYGYNLASRAISLELNSLQLMDSARKNV